MSPRALPEIPTSLKAAVWWWGIAAAVTAAFAVATWLRADILDLGSTAGGIALAVVLTVLAATLCWGTLRLRLGHLAGRLTLTALGLIAGLPLLLKGARMLPLALVLLIGTALLYLPDTVRFFRPQVRARKAGARAERQARKAQGR